MRLYRSVAAILPTSSPRVITLGNFDGMHRGHQWLIAHTIACAKKLGGSSMLLSFDPMPTEYFAPQHCPARLMNFLEKAQFLKNCTLDEWCLLPFNAALAHLSALHFVEKILVETLRAAHIVVGDDFRFGRSRDGDVALLRHCATKCNFQVSTHTECDAHQQPISSTRIRAALKSGDFLSAKTLLGHAYQTTGRVVYGSQLGRTLGCPTANISMQRRVSPVHGIYVVKVAGPNIEHYGVASVGNRPAVGGGPLFVLEVHLFDFSGDLYGQRLQVTYLHKLRDEWMFDSLEALQTQIHLDCQQAQAYISCYGDDL